MVMSPGAMQVKRACMGLADVLANPGAGNGEAMSTEKRMAVRAQLSHHGMDEARIGPGPGTGRGHRARGDLQPDTGSFYPVPILHM